MNAIEIKNLEKKYDDKFKLGKLNLDIPSGCIIGLIGENGAGKTTLIKSILNIINVDEGTIKIFNKDYKKFDSEIKEDIGVVLDNSFFPELITPNEIDLIMKDFFHSWNSDMFFKYMKNFNIELTKSLKTMSKGMRKKVEIATALSHNPKLLILDEPTSGLDPVVRSEVLDIFLDFIKDEEHTIIFSTHVTSDLEHIADYIVFIDNGKIILEKNKDDIIDKYGIMKCSIDEFNLVDKKDIISFKKNKYDYQILIDDKINMKKKYKNFIIDKITLEDLMVLMIKGETK